METGVKQNVAIGMVILLLFFGICCFLTPPLIVTNVAMSVTEALITGCIIAVFAMLVLYIGLVNDLCEYSFLYYARGIGFIISMIGILMYCMGMKILHTYLLML